VSEPLLAVDNLATEFRTPAGTVDVAIGQFDADSPLDLLAVDGDGLVLRSAESGAFELERGLVLAPIPFLVLMVPIITFSVYRLLRGSREIRFANA